jgi:hypothetical protein
MSILLNLPPELETKLLGEASRQGLPLADYLVRILSNGGQSAAGVGSGAELVAYWQQAGVVGVHAEISDSQQHARRLREEATRRERP